ncbi:cell wall-active antibiotics response protein [Enterococcus saccharolyticus]|uniref:cell wall-active antibiotics response protein LiaF n=1 Tax=Enterococcus saccharolyticus TaxID=41997 RepID=UPI001E434A6E|nr:cell wall-active antibiotics response protein LiaF [Enterococcus saccharolyticus]MCD5003366.1 cell wall-active antibiotics response protein [Enterococcus saccharolyticus]
MKSPWRFFFVIEALLFLLAVWQIINNVALLILLGLGILNVLWAVRRKKYTQLKNFQLIIGCLMILISLLNSPALWMMLVFGVLFVGLKGVEISGIDFSKYSFWNKKQMIMVETDEPQNHSGKKKKQQWIGNERIGNKVYEWDDINISIFSGDTIIDLGNTILPKNDNIVLIRKGFGRTRILIPAGIGVQLEHACFAGTVTFEAKETELHNEVLTVVSNDYYESPRRLKIVSNTLLGDLEVIRV